MCSQALRVEASALFLDYCRRHGDGGGWGVRGMIFPSSVAYLFPLLLCPSRFFITQSHSFFPGFCVSTGRSPPTLPTFSRTIRCKRIMRFQLKACSVPGTQLRACLILQKLSWRFEICPRTRLVAIGRRKFLCRLVRPNISTDRMLLFGKMYHSLERPIGPNAINKKSEPSFPKKSTLPVSPR